MIEIKFFGKSSKTQPHNDKNKMLIATIIRIRTKKLVAIPSKRLAIKKWIAQMFNGKRLINFTQDFKIRLN